MSKIYIRAPAHSIFINILAYSDLLLRVDGKISTDVVLIKTVAFTAKFRWLVMVQTFRHLWHSIKSHTKNVEEYFLVQMFISLTINNKLR